MAFENAATVSLAPGDIGIVFQRGAFFGHVGIAFHGVDGPKVAHLRFHYRYATDPYPAPGECWIAQRVAMQSINAKVLTGLLRHYTQNPPRIPFGVNALAARGSISLTAGYAPPPSSDGLTCATFVTEVFRSLALPLVDEETWPARAEDATWVRAVCGMLRLHGADEDHIARVANNVYPTRIRPEEAAAAAGAAPLVPSASFQTVEAAVPVVIEALQRHCAQYHEGPPTPSPLVPYPRIRMH